MNNTENFVKKQKSEKGKARIDAKTITYSLGLKILVVLVFKIYIYI